MTSWTFRLRFRTSPRVKLSIHEPKIQIHVGKELGTFELEVWPQLSGVISEAEWLQLKGGATSEIEAQERGTRVSHALQQAFAKLRIAADFGHRSPQGQFIGKRFLNDTDDRPILDDEHGLMVYESEPLPRLISVGNVTLRLGVSEVRLQSALEAALKQNRFVTEKESIAYDLFTASFFDASPDARLISLVVAIEALLNPDDRSVAARKHVERLINETRNLTEIEYRERDSLVGSLRWLMKESITATGAKYVRTKLGDRTYEEYSAEELWKKAYNIRSNLVHGSVPRPTHDDVSRCAASLEVMVSDLLSGPLLEIDI